MEVGKGENKRKQRLFSCETMATSELPLGLQLKMLQQRETKATTSWKKRESKNKPVEASTKRPVGGFVKPPLNNQHKKGFDPRFEALCGKYENHHFRESYGFLNDLVDDEEKQLENRIKSTKDPEELEALERELSRLRKLHHRVLKETKNFKKDSKLRQVNGKQIFISQRKAKEESLKEKYESLKKEGKLKEFIEKRRKRQASKVSILLSS